MWAPQLEKRIHPQGPSTRNANPQRTRGGSNTNLDQLPALYGPLLPTLLPTRSEPKLKEERRNPKGEKRTRSLPLTGTLMYTRRENLV